MILKFGLEFDDLVFDNQQDNATCIGHIHIGPNGLIGILEKYLGLQGPLSENNSLRIEQYRQAIKNNLKSASKEEFYKSAFEADELGTAHAMLQMRDELLLSGCHFDETDDLPQRIKSIHQLELYFSKRLIPGFADRVSTIIQQLKTKHTELPFDAIQIIEPKSILSKYLLEIFSNLKKKGIRIEYSTKENTIHIKTDLDEFRNRISNTIENTKEKKKIKADGSIIIIKAKRETEAAEFIAKLLKQNIDYRPLCLIPEKNRALDNAIIQEGVSSLGILSASLGRPSLQILKLITAFLWEPIDPYKILEFLNLTLKPLDNQLALVIGRLMAEYPGMKSDLWNFKINEYFNDLENKKHGKNDLSIEQIKDQYFTWFERKRYDVNGSIPVFETIGIFKYIEEWAGTEFEKLGSKNTSLIVLREQAKKIVELLQELPEGENKLSYLKLERIVRTVYEPAPVLFRETETGHLPFIYNNSSICGTVADLLWWNFTDHERDYFFSKWYPEELEYFSKKKWKINTPSDLNRLALWQRNQPVITTKKRIVFVAPEKVAGKNVQAHSLEGDLKALFGDLSPLTYDVESGQGKEYLKKFFNLPELIPVEHQKLGTPKSFLNIKLSDKLKNIDEETFTSLDTLFYYPYKWLFKYKIDLHKTASILSIVKENTLKGNLAHRLFEQLFKEKIDNWNKSDVENWLDSRSKNLMKKEGAVLLMYGKEPDKIAFLRKVKNAAWTLVNMIQNNGWNIKSSEMPLQGKFLGRPVKGKADLVLERGDELAVVDLKWGGKSRRFDQIKNKEDLQLVMYSKLLIPDDNWAHTSYFIISNAEMIARNNIGFKEAKAVDPDIDHNLVNQEIWKKMEETYAWRIRQFRNGKIEIRTKNTIEELNDIYMGELMDFLEMKDDSAPYDDYKTLVNLIE